MVREHVFAMALFLADSAGSDRITTIAVAVIGAISAIASALIIQWVRKPTCDHAIQIKMLEDEIERKDRMLWQMGIDPETGKKVTPP